MNQHSSKLTDPSSNAALVTKKQVSVAKSPSKITNDSTGNDWKKQGGAYSKKPTKQTTTGMSQPKKGVNNNHNSGSNHHN